MINSFDIDGVISIGIYPGPDDIIITGRSIEEYDETMAYLHSKNIHNTVFFNPCKFNEKTRKSSGIFKASTINQLNMINIHFEDDEIQLQEIKNLCPNINLVHVNHDGLINMENVRRDNNNIETNL